MKMLILIMLLVIFGIFVVCGILGLIGTVLGLTFGALGAVIGLAFKIVFSPMIFVIIAVIACFWIFGRRAAK